MRPAGARASNPPTVQTGLWADLGPRTATPPPKTTPRKKPETLAEENARLRARVAELEAVASMAGPARRCEAAQLDVSSAAEPIRQRLEQQRTTILRLEALVERQAKALDATDADGAATEELLDRLARALRGVAELGDGAAPYHTEESKATPPKKLQASLLRTVEALRGRADASKRERRDAALGLDSDAARDRRAARAPIPPRALEKQYGKGWNVVVGKSFGAFVTHEIKTYFYGSVVPGVCVLIWRCEGEPPECDRDGMPISVETEDK